MFLDQYFDRVVGPDSKWKCPAMGTVLLIMFSCHVGYLGFIKFDYGYNIKANVTIGKAVNTLVSNVHL